MVGHINNIFKRERDHNTNWYDASDGTMERGDYLLRNWRGDTSAVLTDGGNIVEYAKYSAYGTAKGIPAGDCDNDGDVDNTDAVIIFGWKNTSTQDARGDLDLDGDVDGADLTLWAPLNGNTLGRGALSLVGIRSGYAGYQLDPAITTMYHVRARKYSTELGRFLSRDPLRYFDGINLYQYTTSNPTKSRDPSGMGEEPDCFEPHHFRGTECKCSGISNAPEQFVGPPSPLGPVGEPYASCCTGKTDHLQLRAIACTLCCARTAEALGLDDDWLSKCDQNCRAFVPPPPPWYLDPNIINDPGFLDPIDSAPPKEDGGPLDDFLPDWFPGYPFKIGPCKISINPFSSPMELEIECGDFNDPIEPWDVLPHVPGIIRDIFPGLPGKLRDLIR